MTRAVRVRPGVCYAGGGPRSSWGSPERRRGYFEPASSRSCLPRAGEKQNLTHWQGSANDELGLREAGVAVRVKIGSLAEPFAKMARPVAAATALVLSSVHGLSRSCSAYLSRSNYPLEQGQAC